MVIYEIKDKVTGSSYIGKTARDFEQRKKQHLYLLTQNKHHNTYLQNIFNKDASRLEFNILEQDIIDLNILNFKEKKWIKTKGTINIAVGGEGGDTMSNHPNKEQIYKKRQEKFPQKRGKENHNFKKVPLEAIESIVNIWNNLEIPTLKEVCEQSGYSPYICKRILEEQGITIPNKYITQKRLRKAGIQKGSRNPNFTQKQKEYIRKRYVEDWIGCKHIAKELGYKSESPILKVINELGVKRSNSEWTQYKNKNRKYKKYGKRNNTP